MRDLNIKTKNKNKCMRVQVIIQWTITTLKWQVVFSRRCITKMFVVDLLWKDFILLTSNVFYFIYLVENRWLMWKVIRYNTGCDEMFFEELMKEASDIAGCFKSRVRHLLHLHVATGMQRYMMRLRRCFTDEKQALIHEGHILIQYITMNAIAIRKILKKYDKVTTIANILFKKAFENKKASSSNWF